MRCAYSIVAGVLLAAAVASAQSALVLDGRVDDWPAADAPLLLDASGGHLFVRWRLDRVEVLSDIADRRLRVRSEDGVLEWRFDTGRGTLSVPGRQPVSLDYVAAGVVAQPSYTARQFELALARDGVLAPLLARGRVQVAVCAMVGEACEDRVQREIALPPPSPRAGRQALPVRDGGAVRIISLNAESSALADARRGDALARLLRAAAPDVLVFQELYEIDAAATAAFLNAALPPATWRAAKRGLDLVVAARTPLEADLIHAYDDYGSVAAFRVGVTAGGSGVLHIINAHLPCCRPPGVEERRAHQMRLAARHIADVRAAAPGAPVLVMGDLNLVGMDTLLDELVSTGVAGLPPLRDMRPVLPGTPLATTWRAAGSRFSPGRLDYLLITPDGFASARAFLLDTGEASDHHAIVADVVPR
jgi:endonuclease/exonuclease/phosphatase family metal-dependent hydrolase